MDELNEQDIVLNIKDKNLIISASAGSGKTSTMIRKIFNTIYENKVDISNLLVLTYTNAAAAEMKNRLNDFLIAKCAESEDREFLQRQINKLSVADISTFHAFYEKLLKANYYLLNINPSFAIADENEIKILQENAFRQTVETFKKEENKYLELFSAFNKKRTEKALFNRILKLQNFLNAEIDAENWLKNISLKMVKDVNVSREILNEFYKKNIENAINNFEKILEIVVKRGQDKIVAHCNSCLSELNLILQSDIFSKQEKLLQFAFERLNSDKNFDLELIKNLKKTKETFNKFVRNIKEENLDLYQENSENLSKIAEKYALFIEFYQKYEENLNILKNKSLLFDFSDIEKMALKLLQIPQVESPIREQYKFVFVDEFQDVNNLQNEILKHLSGQKNLFIVGDPKQSIYAFRQSDVSIFTKTMKNFESDKNSEEFNLKNNYRSNSQILEFCNCIFSNIMTAKTANLDYSNTSKFNPHAKIPTEFEPVNILLCEKNNEEVERQFELYKVFEAPVKKTSFCREAVMIFDEICNLLTKQIFDEKLNSFRKVRYSDIAILVRSRGELSNSLANIFEENGIPYMLNAEKDLKKSKLVLALISALIISTDYYSEIDLATFLNRFCGLNYDDFSHIKNLFPQTDFKTAFLSCVDNKYFKNLQFFEEMVKNFKIKILTDGVFNGLNWLIQNSSFKDFLNEIENYEEEMQMMQNFLNFVETNKYNDNLILLLNLINENETLKVEQNLSAGLDRVNITTIHASKGLEYNIVFLSGLGKSIFKNIPNASDIKINKDLGIALKINEEEKTTIFEKAIKIKEKDLELAESLRLLYVGMTRAKNHLFLTAESDFTSVEKVDEDNLKFVEDSYMQYILGSLNSEAISAVCSGQNYICNEFKIQFADQKLCKNKVKSNNFTQIQNENLVLEIEKLAEYNFESDLSELAQKTSVSEIIKSEDEYESINFLPQTLQIDEHLEGIQNGVEIGNAFHEIMERIDFEMSENAVKFVCEDVYNNYVENGIKLEENFVEFSCKLCRKALEEIKMIIEPNCKIYKEKKFMINASPSEVLGNGNAQKVLIQGIIDFFAIGEKITLIDYKYSFINNDEKLKEKYKNQLKIYAFAIEKFTNKKADNSYLLNLRNGHLIKI